MFETIKRNYLAGKINAAGVQNAVKKGWITQAQAVIILGIEEEVQAAEVSAVEEAEQAVEGSAAAAEEEPTPEVPTEEEID